MDTAEETTNAVSPVSVSQSQSQSQTQVPDASDHHAAQGGTVATPTQKAGRGNAAAAAAAAAAAKTEVVHTPPEEDMSVTELQQFTCSVPWGGHGVGFAGNSKKGDKQRPPPSAAKPMRAWQWRLAVATHLIGAESEGAAPPEQPPPCARSCTCGRCGCTCGAFDCWCTAACKPDQRLRVNETIYADTVLSLLTEYFGLKYPY
jgi:hypothetical protein